MEFSWESFKKFAKSIPGFLISLLVGLLLLTGVLLLAYRVIFLTFVDNYEQCYIYDLREGKIRVVTDRGYVFAWPVVERVHKIDLRPMQVCINANSRVLNCKLVQFLPEGLELFVSWHGRGDYDTPGNTGTATTLSNILMSYAYEESGKTYPFLKIIRVLKPEEVVEKK